MTAYAIGVLQEVKMNADIVRYLAEIDATLAPYHGRFIIHGGPQEIREGIRLGDVIVVAFPNLYSAKAWYDSDEYQRIVGLRTGSSIGSVFIMEGVDVHHRGVDVLPESMRPLVNPATITPPGIVAVNAATRADAEFAFPSEMCVGDFDGRYRGLYTYTSQTDAEQRFGFYESGPGTLQARDWHRDEWCHVLEGRLVTVDLDGSTHRFSAGDNFIIPKGWCGDWTTETFFRKVSVLF